MIFKCAFNSSEMLTCTCSLFIDFHFKTLLFFLFINTYPLLFLNSCLTEHFKAATLSLWSLDRLVGCCIGQI